MDFKVYKVKKIKSTKEAMEKIRVSFGSLKKYKKEKAGYSLKILIGKKIADQVGMNRGDKITFSYNPENNGIWLLKKSTDGCGFTLGKQNEYMFILQLTWDLSKLEDKDFSIREVRHDIYQEGIRIYNS